VEDCPVEAVDIDFVGDQRTTLSHDALNSLNGIARDLQDYLCAQPMARNDCEAARWRSVRCPVVFSSGL
jgi:hypothetical protein